MSSIDKQRIAAVEALQRLGWTFDGKSWTGPAFGVSVKVTDNMHTLLMWRADELAGCTEGSPEAKVLEVIANTIEAYEAERWPTGRSGRK